MLVQFAGLFSRLIEKPFCIFSVNLFVLVLGLRSGDFVFIGLILVLFLCFFEGGDEEGGLAPLYY